MELFSLIILFVISIFTGLYGTLIGGGALIIVPILIFFGLSPQNAVGTSKLGGLGVVSIGTYNFTKHKLVDYRIGWIMAVAMILGTVIGSVWIISLDENFVKKLIAVFMFVILAIILVNKKVGTKKRKIKIKWYNWVFSFIIMFLIGIYAGLFGGGYGILMSYVLLFVFGQTFLESAGTRKIPALISNLIAFFIFWINGLVNFIYGIVLFVGSFIGSFIGSYYAPKIGNRIIRYGFMIAVFISAVGLLIK